MNVQTDLDIPELLHLSVQASARGESDKAILYAKQALAENPDDPMSLFLLGGFHADLGLLERACREIGRAVEVQPGFDAARLQLALLQIVCGDIEASLSTLGPLTDAAREGFYGEFGRGFVHMLEGRLGPAAKALERGILLNDADPGLNSEIGEILAVILHLHDAPRLGDTDDVAAAVNPPDEHALRRALMSRYQHPDTEAP